MSFLYGAGDETRTRDVFLGKVFERFVKIRENAWNLVFMRFPEPSSKMPSRTKTNTNEHFLSGIVRKFWFIAEVPALDAGESAF